MSTEAYSALFMELVTDTDAAIEFMNGIIPAGLIPEEATVTPIKPPEVPVQYMTMKQAEEYRVQRAHGEDSVT